MSFVVSLPDTTAPSTNLSASRCPVVELKMLTEGKSSVVCWVLLFICNLTCFSGMFGACTYLISRMLVVECDCVYLCPSTQIPTSWGASVWVVGSGAGSHVSSAQINPELVSVGPRDPCSPNRGGSITHRGVSQGSSRGGGVGCVCVCVSVRSVTRYDVCVCVLSALLPSSDRRSSSGCSFPDVVTVFVSISPFTKFLPVCYHLCSSEEL